jgi:hypothetical protein
MGTILLAGRAETSFQLQKLNTVPPPPLLSPFIWAFRRRSAAPSSPRLSRPVPAHSNLFALPPFPSPFFPHNYKTVSLYSNPMVIYNATAPLQEPGQGVGRCVTNFTYAGTAYAPPPIKFCSSNYIDLPVRIFVNASNPE